jgi:hypothetical protein
LVLYIGKALHVETFKTIKLLRKQVFGLVLSVKAALKNLQQITWGCFRKRIIKPVKGFLKSDFQISSTIYYYAVGMAAVRYQFGRTPAVLGRCFCLVGPSLFTFASCQGLILMG